MRKRRCGKTLLPKRCLPLGPRRSSREGKGLPKKLVKEMLPGHPRGHLRQRHRLLDLCLDLFLVALILCLAVRFLLHPPTRRLPCGSLDSPKQRHHHPSDRRRKKGRWRRQEEEEEPLGGISRIRS